MAPHRLHRLPAFDYRGLHAYFLTMCTSDRHPAFANHAFAADAAAQLLRSATTFHFAVPAYCLMPDHVHIVLEGEQEDSDMKSFVQSWNTSVGFRWRRAHGTALWQGRYYDHVLRNDVALLEVARYVVMNPVRASLVQKAEDYPFSGSSRYTIAKILEAAGDWRPTW